MQPGRFQASLPDEVRGDRETCGKVPLPICIWGEHGRQRSNCSMATEWHGGIWKVLFVSVFWPLREAQKRLKGGIITPQRLPPKKMAQTKTKTIVTVTKPGWHTSQRMWERQSMTVDLKPCLHYKIMVPPRATWSTFDSFGWQDQSKKPWMHWAYVQTEKIQKWLKLLPRKPELQTKQ